MLLVILVVPAKNGTRFKIFAVREQIWLVKAALEPTNGTKIKKYVVMLRIRAVSDVVLEVFGIPNKRLAVHRQISPANLALEIKNGITSKISAALLIIKNVKIVSRAINGIPFKTLAVFPLIPSANNV